MNRVELTRGAVRIVCARIGPDAGAVHLSTSAGETLLCAAAPIEACVVGADDPPWEDRLTVRVGTAVLPLADADEAARVRDLFQPRPEVPR